MVVGSVTPGWPVTGVCETLAIVVGTTLAEVDDGEVVAVDRVAAERRERDGEPDTDQAALARVSASKMPKGTHERHRLTAIVQGYAWSRHRGI